jgi:heptosyltransferase-2
MRILIIQTAFIGDVILATSLLEAVHSTHPNSSIDFLLRKGNEGLFEEHPFINQIIIWNKKKHKYTSLWDCLKRIRNEKYDIVFNLHRFASSGFLAGFSGAKTIVGFDKNPLSFLFTKRAKHSVDSGMHECKRNLQLLELVGFRNDNQRIQPKLYVKPLSLKLNKPFVCIAPASVWFTKQWPIEKWISLIHLIPEKFHVYLLGSASDVELSQVIMKHLKRNEVSNMTGKLNLLESAALMQEAQMNYVNDSAPMHLCSAVNAPVTAIFCSTVPEFGFGPLSETSFIMQLTEPLYCRPCGLHGKASCPETHFKCALLIDEHAVAKTCL